MSIGDLHEQELIAIEMVEKAERELRLKDEAEKARKERKMYLQLYHGRTSPGEQLEDWGTDGPVFGPLQWFHVTYLANFGFAYEDKDKSRFGDTDGEFSFVEDLLYYDGVYYGDWSVFMASEEDLENRDVDPTSPTLKSRLVKWEQEKAQLPDLSNNEDTSTVRS